MLLFFELVIKGFLIGFAFVVPGMSGGTLAVYLGLYDKLIHAIGNIFKEFKKSITFLLPVVIGIAISVVALSYLFGLLLNWNSFIVLFFFIGLMLGGLRSIYKTAKTDKLKIPAILSFLIAFAVVIFLVVFKALGNTGSVGYIDINFKNLIIIFLVGMAASMTMIVPGISGSALLLVLGYYTVVVTNVVGNILDFSNLLYNLEVLIPFALGAALGVILFSRVIEYCLKKYKSITYYAILGFILASCLAIFFEIKDPSTATLFENQLPIYNDLIKYLAENVWSIVGGLATLVGGFFAAKYLTKLEMVNK